MADEFHKLKISVTADAKVADAELRAKFQALKAKFDSFVG